MTCKRTAIARVMLATPGSKVKRDGHGRQEKACYKTRYRSANQEMALSTVLRCRSRR